MVGKIHITIPWGILKRFFREYAVALSGTLLFLVLLSGLLVSRYYALVGLDDLSKLNPLITTQGNQLIGRDRAFGAIADQNQGDSPNNPTTTPKTSQQPSSSSNPSTKTPSTNQGQTSQPVSSGSGGSSGGGTTTSPPPTQFTVSIGTMTHVAGSPSGLLGALNPVCTITHQFTASVHAINGPGTMNYTWVQSDGKTSGSDKENFGAGTSDDQVTYQWKITSTSGDYSIKLSVSSPNQTDKTLSFRHQCIL